MYLFLNILPKFVDSFSETSEAQNTAVISLALILIKAVFGALSY